MDYNRIILERWEYLYTDPDWDSVYGYKEPKACRKEAVAASRADIVSGSGKAGQITNILLDTQKA